jgi:hypothetical protein
MRSATPRMPMLARQIIAGLIVAWSLFLSAAPIVQAAAGANDSCPCCKRSARKCSYRTHHSDPSSGSAFDAVPDCYQGCAQTPGLPPSTGHFSIQASLVRFLSPAAAQSLAAYDFRQPTSSDSFSLYQRPPPRS